MHFRRHRGPALARESYYTAEELQFLHTVASVSFPGHPPWCELAYPGSGFLTVEIIAVTYPLPSGLLPPLERLHERMNDDKVIQGYIEPHVSYEHRQGHLWVAAIGEGVHLPIGQTIFLADSHPSEPVDRPAAQPVAGTGELHLKIEPEPDPAQEQSAAQPVFDETKVVRWWLFHTWLMPEYRNRKIFKCSVGYFRQWHPGFVLREHEPRLKSALRIHPEHLPDNTAVKWV